MPVKHSWLRAVTGTVASAALLPLGLVACNPAAAAPLKCTALAGPAQNTTETIGIKTVADAKVVTAAHYLTGPEKQTTTTNGLGVGSVTYSIGSAGTKTPVKVTVAVSKGARKGSCSTSFTPAAPVGAPQPTPLAATITPRWVNVSSGTSLAGSPGTCTDPHPGTGMGCGTLAISALITGFSQYGGIPACAVTNGCFDDRGPALTGQLDLSWKLSCDSTHVVSEHDNQTMQITPEWNGHNTEVNSFTRVSDDSARLELAVDMPFSADINSCTGSSTLVSVSASNVSLHLTSGGSFPAGDFSDAGPFSN